MSFKKTEKKTKKSTFGGARSASIGAGTSPPSSSLVSVSTQQSGSGAGSGTSLLPEGAKSKLWELFGQIEHEFENLYSENAAREFLSCFAMKVLRDSSCFGAIWGRK